MPGSQGRAPTLGTDRHLGRDAQPTVTVLYVGRHAARRPFQAGEVRRGETPQFRQMAAAVMERPANHPVLHDKAKRAFAHVPVVVVQE